jgi:hypothetical protein
VAPLQRRSLLRRLRGARGAASSTPLGSAPKTWAVCSILAIAIGPGTVASAAEDPVPPPTTTTVDAPPPDPYSPPAPVTPKPKPKPAARRVAPASPVQTYTPPAPVRPRPAVQTSSAAPQRRAKVARKQKQKQRRRPVERVAKPAPVRVDFAPLDGLIASARLPVVPERDANDPYLWLAGLSFAVLGVAGTGLLMLTLRSFRQGWE